jgi:hypothetical protein
VVANESLDQVLPALIDLVLERATEHLSSAGEAGPEPTYATRSELEEARR